MSVEWAEKDGEVAGKILDGLVAVEVEGRRYG